MKKTVAYLFILAGLFIIVYPSANRLYGDYVQQQLIQEWEMSDAGVFEEEEARDSFGRLTEIFTEELAETTVKASQVSPQPKMVQSGKKTEKAAKAKNPQLLGTIEIKKIGAKLPILTGATQKNLKYGAGHLTGTDLPGQKGNTAIAAHRSRTFGKMFNRLGELKAGDMIVIRNQNKAYKYKVFKTSIVSPDNTSVLERNGDDALLTLITCDPVDKATHRLIIHARLVP